MNTTQVIVHGTIKPDGTLELNQPLNLPPGQVQITVQHIETSFQTKEDLRSVLERIRARQQARGHVPRTREEIDADINALRNEAEEEMQKIENIQTYRDTDPR